MRVTPTGPEEDRERRVLRRAKANAVLQGVTLSQYVLEAIEARLVEEKEKVS